MTRVLSLTAATALVAAATGLSAAPAHALGGQEGEEYTATSDVQQPEYWRYTGLIEVDDGATTADVDVEVDGVIESLPGTGKVASGEMIVGKYLLDIDFEDDGTDLLVFFENSKISGEGTCEVRKSGWVVCEGDLSLPLSDTDFIFGVIPHTESSD